MVVAAKKVCLKFEEVLVEAYQITSNEREQLLLTHRQIGESIGKSKQTAQRFLKQHQNDFPEPILAKIPDRPRPVALTPIETAVNYWKFQADAGNSTAKTLIAAFDSIEIATNNSEPNTTTEDTTPKSELQLIAEGIEIASQWMSEAGIEPGAITSWRLNELAKQIPSLSQINTSAQALIAQSLPTPSGMIPSQLAEQLSLLTERKITAAQVNKALHELELQDWANPGKNRERKLTEAGKQYGIALLTTSADGWQGAQLRWFEVENNNKFIRRKKNVREQIERYCLSQYDLKKLGGYDYELTIPYETEQDLENTIYEIYADMEQTADYNYCFTEADIREIGTDRSW